MGNGSIGMAEDRRDAQQDFEGDGRCAGRTQQDHRDELDTQGEQRLQRVEAHTGRDIELDVSVVGAMQPPEQRDTMQEPMVAVDRQIQQQDAEGGGEQIGRGQVIEPRRRNVQPIGRCPPSSWEPRAEASGCSRGSC